MKTFNLKAPKISTPSIKKIGSFKMPSTKMPSMSKLTKGIKLPKTKKLAIIKAKIAKHVRI